MTSFDISLFLELTYSAPIAELFSSREVSSLMSRCVLIMIIHDLLKAEIIMIMIF